MPEPKPRPCPICGRPSDFFAPPTGPFCSDRCQRVDLGKWLNEEYRLSEPLSPTDLDDALADSSSPDSH